MKKHSSKILRLASLMASRESGFIFAFIGVMVQSAHTWMIAYDLSSLDGFWRLIQAGAMAFFISAALLYFVLKSSDGDNPRAKKWRKTVNMFAWLETCINLYYWGHKLLWEAWPDPDYGSFIIAIPFSFVIPLTLKAYSSEVRVEDFSDVDDNEPKENIETDGLSVADVEKIAKDLFDTNLKMNLSMMGLDLKPVDDKSLTFSFDFLDNPEGTVYSALMDWHKKMHKSSNDPIIGFESKVEEPIVEEPIAEETVIEPIVEEPIAEETKIEEPIAEEPIADEPVSEEPKVEETVVEQIVDEPVAEEPKVSEPEVNILGKEIANQLNNVVVSNGGFDTNPAYVSPKGNDIDINNDPLFQYPKA